MPATGVIDLNACQGLIYEEIDLHGIDLGRIEHNRTCKSDECFHDVGGIVLIGDWRRSWEWRADNGYGKAVPPHTKGSKRKQVWAEWEDKPDGRGFSAIYNKDELTIQVAWSRWVQRDAQPCSPCYPGQGSIGTADGDMEVYILPAKFHCCFDCDSPDEEKTMFCPDGRVRCKSCAVAYAIAVAEEGS